MENNNRKSITLKLPRFRFNAPVTLVFAALCLIALVIDLLTQGAANSYVFSVYRSSPADPLTYVRCITHVLGHADWDHLLSNMMYVLLLGPMLEEKYGGWTLICLMLSTAVVTGLVNMLLFPGIALLGASGIVFAMILLASFSSFDGNGIPVTFLLIALLYLGREVLNGLFTVDNVSQFGHIVGGVIGSATGFLAQRVRNRHSFARKA